MASHTISLSGQTETFTCEDGDTLLRAALRAGLGFPYECNSGGCGSCKFELIDGEVDNIWPEAPGLSERDIKKSRQLSCQCIPRSDCELKVRLNAKFSPLQPPVKTTARLYEIRPITENMSEFCFQTEQPAQFSAGQFALFDMPGVKGPRAYSMSNVANDDKRWHFIIKKMPAGQGSTHLFEQYQVGDTLTLDGPYGLSFLKSDIQRDIVCIAGGSGLSPEMSILKAAVVAPSLAQQNIYLFYGARTPNDICSADLIEKDAELSQRVQHYDVVSDLEAAKKAGWNGDVGYVHEILTEKLSKSLNNYEYYICGPAAMIDSVLKKLIVEHKVPQEQIHYDRFY